VEDGALAAGECVEHAARVEVVIREHDAESDTYTVEWSPTKSEWPDSIAEEGVSYAAPEALARGPESKHWAVAAKSGKHLIAGVPRPLLRAGEPSVLDRVTAFMKSVTRVR